MHSGESPSAVFTDQREILTSVVLIIVVGAVPPSIQTEACSQLRRSCPPPRRHRFTDRELQKTTRWSEPNSGV